MGAELHNWRLCVLFHLTEPCCQTGRIATSIDKILHGLLFERRWVGGSVYFSTFSTINPHKTLSSAVAPLAVRNMASHSLACGSLPPLIQLSSVGDVGVLALERGNAVMTKKSDDAGPCKRREMEDCKSELLFAGSKRITV